MIAEPDEELTPEAREVLRVLQRGGSATYLDVAAELRLSRRAADAAAPSVWRGSR